MKDLQTELDALDKECDARRSSDAEREGGVIDLLIEKVIELEKRLNDNES